VLDIVSLLVLAVGRSRLLGSLEFRAFQVDFDHKVLRFGGYLRNDGIAQDFASLIDCDCLLGLASVCIQLCTAHCGLQTLRLQEKGRLRLISRGHSHYIWLVCVKRNGDRLGCNRSGLRLQLV